MQETLDLVRTFLGWRLLSVRKLLSWIKVSIGAPVFFKPSRVKRQHII
jgi:hypothetical protein